MSLDSNIVVLKNLTYKCICYCIKLFFYTNITNINIPKIIIFTKVEVKNLEKKSFKVIFAHFGLDGLDFQNRNFRKFVLNLTSVIFCLDKHVSQEET